MQVMYSQKQRMALFVMNSMNFSGFESRFLFFTASTSGSRIVTVVARLLELFVFARIAAEVLLTEIESYVSLFHRNFF